MMKKTGTARATIIDIAHQAGVSITTVSRVLNNSMPVAEETSRRVWQAVEALEFIPNSAARRLASKRTNTIGLILPGISGAFFPPMLSGIEHCVNEAGYDLLIYATSDPQRRARNQPQPVSDNNADGLLVFVNSLDNLELARLHRRGLPIVLLHQSSPEGLQIPSVTFENKNGAEKIVSHLIEAHNCRQIAFISGPADNEDAAWREKGYHLALEKHGLSANPNLREAGEFSDKAAFAAVKRLLQKGIPFDGIFSCDDESAAGVLQALSQNGLRVPEDMPVVGFDDDYIAPHLSTPLTTVHAPIEEAAYEAAHQLINLIRTGSAESLVILPTEIVLRRSCGCHPTA